MMTLPEFNGPNEGLLCLYSLHLLTAAVGSQDRRAAPYIRTTRNTFPPAPVCPRLPASCSLPPEPTLRVDVVALPASVRPSGVEYGLRRGCRVWGPLFRLPGMRRPLSGIELVMLSSTAGAVLDAAVRFRGVACRPGKRGRRHALATLAPLFGLVRRAISQPRPAVLRHALPCTHA